MRTLTAHAINPANEALLVRAIDDHGHGNAHHWYEIAVASVDDPERDGNPGQPRVLCSLHFQNGPAKETGVGVNGITHEALLAVLIDRLEGFQAGPYAHRANEMALVNLRYALDALHSRTHERMQRGIEGTHIV